MKSNSVRSLLGLVVFMCAIMVTSVSIAHEGHGVPGSVPPAPHGGKLKEAKGGKAELFYEVTYKGSDLKIYPLRITDQGVFEAVAPKELSKVTVKAENPKTKKTETLTTTSTDESFDTKYTAKGTSRFFVHVSSTYRNESKNAKIQVEKN